MPTSANAEPAAGGPPSGGDDLDFGRFSESVRAEVDARLERCLEAHATSVAGHPAAHAVVESVAALTLRGGKRLRSALAGVGFRLVSDEPLPPQVFQVGVALELLQSYLLIHDDWMDGDATRRGGPSVHVALAEKLGDQRLGDRAAVLAGDWAAAAALEELVRLDRSEGRALAAGFAAMQRSVVLGQALDLLGEDADPEQVYRWKTGSYTVKGPLVLGALAAQPSEQQLNALERVAEPLGVAFQLRDDLLGAFGDPSETGKPRGSDLRARKRTPLLLGGLARARGQDADLLGAVLQPGAEVDVDAALAALRRTGAEHQVEARISALVAEARVELGAAELRAGGRRLLEGALSALVLRSR